MQLELVFLYAETYMFRFETQKREIVSLKKHIENIQV